MHAVLFGAVRALFVAAGALLLAACASDPVTSNFDPTADLSKYNSHDPRIAPPAPGYVLVVDQTRGDASVLASGATPEAFREMLAVARIEHPGARIYIKTHPETHAGKHQRYGSSVWLQIMLHH